VVPSYTVWVKVLNDMSRLLDRIYLVLPYTLDFSMPLHAPRFLESIKPGSTNRPHPALLYMLFTAGIYVLGKKLPPRPGASPIPSSYPRPDTSVYPFLIDLEMAFYDRARSELEIAIQTNDRLDQLTKACTGMARYLVHTGRVMEASMLPFVRLAVACGMHRITNNVVPMPTLPSRLESIASNSNNNVVQPESARSVTFQLDLLDAEVDNGQVHPQTREFKEPEPRNDTVVSSYDYRPKLVVVPPPVDAIALWERVETFWAVKELDWGITSVWGWSAALADSEIQTAWPKDLSVYTSVCIRVSKGKKRIY
jgi:hypothetical protein